MDIKYHIFHVWNATVLFMPTVSLPNDMVVATLKESQLHVLVTANIYMLPAKMSAFKSNEIISLAKSEISNQLYRLLVNQYFVSLIYWKKRGSYSTMTSISSFWLVKFLKFHEINHLLMWIKGLRNPILNSSPFFSINL